MANRPVKNLNPPWEKLLEYFTDFNQGNAQIPYKIAKTKHYPCALFEEREGGKGTANPTQVSVFISTVFLWLIKKITA